MRPGALAQRDRKAAMSPRMCWALMLLCLGPAAASSAVAQESQDGPPAAVESVAAQAAGDGEAEETQETGEAGTQEEEERAWGIFSSFVNLFRGDPEEGAGDEEDEAGEEAGSPEPGADPDEGEGEGEGAAEGEADEREAEQDPEAEEAGRQRAPDAEQDPEREAEAEQEGSAPQGSAAGGERTPGREEPGEGAAAAPDDAESREPAERADAPPEAEEDLSGITTDHVYQATVDLLAELTVIREAQSFIIAGDPPGEPALRDDERLVLVYLESREVMEKTARLQTRLGMIPVEVAPIPVRDIEAPDLYRSVQASIEELRRVKRQLVIKQEIAPAPLAGDATPALVYRNLEHASLLLDALIGRPVTFNDVYMHVLQVQDEVTLIAAALGVALSVEPPAVVEGRGPMEVAQQVLRTIYKTISLQSRLGMEASPVPDAPPAQVTPAEVFDATNLLLAEVMRIKVHMNVRSPHPERRLSRKKQASDVFAELLLMQGNLDAMAKAAGDSG